MPVNSARALSLLGKVSLFIGIEAFKWSVEDFQRAAQFARASNVDSLIVKAADGTNAWYGGASGFKAIRQAILAEGVGCLPYIYSYGDKFSGLNGELELIATYLSAFGLMAVDLETEWNGQVKWAQQFAQRLAGEPQAIYLSCMADPAIQNQNAVFQALAPAISVWMPQIYTDYLQTVWYQQFKALGIGSGFCPTYDLRSEFGPNNALAHVSANALLTGGYASVWEYGAASGANNSLLKSIVAQVKPTGDPNTSIVADIKATLLIIGEMSEHALAQLARLQVK